MVGIEGDVLGETCQGLTGPTQDGFTLWGRVTNDREVTSSWGKVLKSTCDVKTTNGQILAM